MMDGIQKSRNGDQKIFSLKFCIFFGFIVLVIHCVQKDRFNSSLTLITDFIHKCDTSVSCDSYESIFFVLACSFYITFMALCFCSFFVYWVESMVKKQPVLSSRIVEYLDFKIGCSVIFLFLALYLCKENVSDVWDVILLGILLTAFALFFATCYNLAFDYDEVDLSMAQSSKTSIGAIWAVGAYEAFYKLTLEGIIKKIGAFETKYSIQIPVKKLFIICPLSCNVNGSFNDKDNRIFDKGQLEPLECDQGANTNRRYKHSVYGIQRDYDEPTYVVAEFASPLGTLWEMRNTMKKEMLRYHRDCLIQNVKDLLRDYPCVVLEYDDQTTSNTEPFYRFLLSSIQKQSEDRNVMVQEEKNFL